MNDKPKSVAELMGRGVLSFNAVVANTKEKVQACILTDNDGKERFVFPVLGTDVPVIDNTILKAKGWTIKFAPLADVALTEITQSFWTCACRTEFVHHKSCTYCCVCNRKVTDTLFLVEHDLEALLQWKLIVGE